MDVVRLLEAATKSKTVDKIYVDAANHVLNVRKALVERSLQDEEVNQNERFFTGALCDALNSVLGSGISVLHQGCIGKLATHSDFSARDVRSDRGTLMVGEGKIGESSTIRDQTRGQLFNELIRHRSIDAKLGFTQGARPILLLAVDFGNISVELAFPSKKGNAMEQWVSFEDSVEQGTETFWTTQVASVHYAKAEGKKKLPKVLRFIAEALEYLTRVDAHHPRQQFKTPFVTAIDEEETPHSGEKRGENVTIIEMESGKKRVYKEFCYYLRQEDGFNMPEDAIEECDQRKPPSDELLQCLDEKYASWKVESGPFEIQILSYDFIDGSCWPTSKESWIDVLAQVESLHSHGYVHGDLLPRNTIFSGAVGFVIDFDLTRKQGEPYVNGYNHKDFAPFRHPEARACQPMCQAHDVWSLTEMTKTFFDIDLSGLTTGTVSELLQVFSSSDAVKLRDADEAVVAEATGSPPRC